jgi:hypothetical protein
LGWTIEFNPEAIKDLNKLNRSIRSEIFSYLQERIAQAESPRNFGKPLRYDKFSAPGRRCPVNVLDHYLPKRPHGVPTIVPKNLVPCCRDCNTAKMDEAPMNEMMQLVNIKHRLARLFAKRGADAVRHHLAEEAETRCRLCEFVAKSLVSSLGGR